MIHKTFNLVNDTMNNSKVQTIIISTLKKKIQPTHNIIKKSKFQEVENYLKKLENDTIFESCKLADDNELLSKRQNNLQKSAQKNNLNFEIKNNSISKIIVEYLQKQKRIKCFLCNWSCEIKKQEKILMDFQISSCLHVACLECWDSFFEIFNELCIQCNKPIIKTDLKILGEILNNL